MRKFYLFFASLVLSAAAIAQPTTFNYSGTITTYTVSPGTTSLTITAAGAQGGNSSFFTGGLGATMRGDFAVTPGQVLRILVGQQPSPGANAGGGGGGSFVWDDVSGTLLIAAGGGGGAGFSGATNGFNASTSTSGTNGGAPATSGAGTGGNGGTQPTSVTYWACGGAGWNTNGNAGSVSGSCTCSGGVRPSAGGAGGTFVGGTSVGNGGFGGGGGANARCGIVGGGGGGGYSGGGPGADNSSVYSAGGGGGSFNSGTAQTNAVDRTGNGIVIIAPPPCTNPPASTGNALMCVGGVTTFSNTVATGTWSSSNTSVATVNSATGAITGNAVGTANISFIVPGGCFSSRVVTVNPAPSVASISTNSPLCAGGTLSLTANLPANVTSYSWLGAAAVTGGTTASASVSGISTSGSGIYSLTVTNGSDVNAGCSVVYTTSATVLASPAANVGASSICLGQSSSLSNSTPAGTWSSSNTGVATISSSGIISTVAAGTTNISYTLASGCAGVTVLTVNALPTLVVGPSSTATVCLGSSTSFSASAPGSVITWNDAAATTTLSCTSCGTVNVTPNNTGVHEIDAIATSAAGCVTTNTVTVNANPVPPAISGASNVCIGTSTTLTSGAGGTWVSSAPGVATVGISSGLVSGVSAGNAVISYVLPSGCFRTFNVSVLSSAAPISGSAAVCSGQVTALSHPVSGGVWSSGNATIASVNPSGNVTGGTAGNTIITYTLPSGCAVTTVATVNGLPAAIGGTNAVCQGSATTLTNTDAGGTWSSLSGNVSVNAVTGAVTGINAGTAVVSYSLATGCARTRIVTVNATPAAITGTSAICHNSIGVLSNSTAGGVWSSSNTGVALVDASGTVTGIAPGIVTITYTLGSGCRTTTGFVVNALPSAISGNNFVCQNSTTNLSNTDGGGTWSSSNTSIATVNPSTGDVTGGNAGNATITYTLATGCRRTTTFTVNALPTAISGTASVCIGDETTLYNFSGGGAWISGAPGIASIAPTGVVSGVSAGLASITYELPTGCLRTQVVTVNALPGTIGGANALCAGASTLMSNPTPGGNWSSSNPSAATIDAMGMLSAVAAGNTTLTYTSAQGCITTKAVAINALPGNITGTAAVCEGQNISLNNSTAGGAWSSESDATASVNTIGTVTGVAAGAVHITYTLGTGCYRTRIITVNATPAAITGASSVCVGSATDLSSTSTGGAWTTNVSGVAPVSATGTVSGLSAGTAIISYTLPTGCRTTASIAVNPLPASITGALNVCAGNTTTLGNSTGSGAWSTTDASIADISAGGIVSGVSAGTTGVTYTLPTGCFRTAVINVNPLPAAIGGNLSVCHGSTTVLTNTGIGGFWTSSNTSVATINSVGTTTGLTVGSSNITYTLPTGCRTVSNFVVNPLPAAIGGSLQVCVGSTAMVSNSTINGAWSSSNTSVATVDATGTVSGITAGTATLTYTLATGCYKTATLTVNALPVATSGPATLCQTNSAALSNGTGGGSWSSSNTSLAMVNGAGIVTAVAPGAVVINYTLPTGCAVGHVINIEAAPAPISGVNTVCVGSSVTVGSTSTGGFWSTAASNATASYLGEVTGLSAGTAVITYTLPSGCFRTRTMTVNPLPSASVGAATVCTGSQITLSNATMGGSWSTNSPSLATVSSTGVVSGLATGAARISYTLPTGCSSVHTVTVNATPDAIGGTMSICAGNSTTLNNMTLGGVWTSSNTSVATVGLTGGNVTGISAGTATITYVMSTGCYTTAEVVVNANPMSIGGTTAICQGNSGVLTNSTLGGMWSIADAGVATIDAMSGVVNGVAAGSSFVTYSLPTGCFTTGSVAVNSLPTAQTVTGGGSYCAGGAGVSVGLSGSDAGTTYMLYRAGFGTPIGTFSGTGAPLFFGSLTTSGTYSVMATTAAGCSSNMGGTASVIVTPVVIPTAAISNTVGDTVCNGTTVTFGASSTNTGSGATYIWRVNGTTVATGTDSYAYSPANGDAVSVTVTSTEACAVPATVSATQVITVLPNLAPSVEISSSPSNKLCAGTMAMFAAAATNGGDAPVYVWKKNTTITMGTGATLSYTPANGDVITCWLTSNYRCPSVNNVSSNAITMEVAPVYVPEVAIEVTPGTTVEEGQTVTFASTVTNAGPTPSYQWLRNGVVVMGANSANFTTANLMNGDSITCVVRGSGDCGQTTMNSVVMTVLPTSSVVKVGGLNSDITLTPNPTTGAFTVRGTLATASAVTMEVTNMLGQTVFTKSLPSSTSVNERIELNNELANGMYIFTITAGTDRQSFHFMLKK